MQKKKLLFSINTLSAKGGGAEKVFSIITNELVNDPKYEINIITFDKKKQKLFYKLKSKIKIFRLGDKEFFSNKILKNINRLVLMIIWQIKHKPDLCFGFMHSNFVNLGLASLITKTKVIACEHIVPQHYTERRLEYFLIKITAPIFEKITVVSNQAKKLFSKKLQNKMIVLDNTVEISIQKKFKKLKNNKIILSIGRLEEQKNYLTLIHAFNLFEKKNKGWKLKIIGEGSQKFKIIQAIKYFNLQKKVSILNFTKNLYSHYKNSSLYACTSIYESFGLTVAEAISLNLPVIGFNSCPGINKLINSNNGVLVKSPIYDYKTFADEMDRLLKNKKKIQKIKNSFDKKLFNNNITTNVLIKWQKIINKLI